LNYQSTSDWVEAVSKEIFSVLIPDISAEFDSPVSGKTAEEVMEALPQWKDDCQVAVTIMEAVGLLEYELKQSELLDAWIARKIKLCFELKAMEEMRDKK
jgi:hypothetical protein